MAERDIDIFAARLGNPNLGRSSRSHLYQLLFHRLDLSDSLRLTNLPDPKVKLNHAMELRDNVEFLCAGAIYPVFLRKLIPIFLKLLEGPPIFISTSWIQVRYLLECVMLSSGSD